MGTSAALPLILSRNGRELSAGSVGQAFLPPASTIGGVAGADAGGPGTRADAGGPGTRADAGGPGTRADAGGPGTRADGGGGRCGPIAARGETRGGAVRGGGRRSAARRDGGRRRLRIPPSALTTGPTTRLSQPLVTGLSAPEPVIAVMIPNGCRAGPPLPPPAGHGIGVPVRVAHTVSSWSWTVWSRAAGLGWLGRWW